ncbi:MAG: hypothetical protein A2143_05630 [Gallionellales bacterium RBG_16_57_15]|nr:MAG: hypothetical protein A2143_05630 [Gallionellales bacterium RBG_16_57_15]
MAHDQASRDETHFLLRLRLVSKITLIVSAAFCLGMLLALTFITDDSGIGYSKIIRSHNLSRRYLAHALLAAGVFLVLFSIVVTWLISRRISFHIAGPLYRFARNLETFIEHGPVTPVPTRKSDHLKQEERQIKHSIARVQAHYGAMRAATEAALAQINSQQFPAAAFAQLKELDRASRL